jgi:hypothetical protein
MKGQLIEAGRREKAYEAQIRELKAKQSLSMSDLRGKPKYNSGLLTTPQGKPPQVVGTLFYNSQENLLTGATMSNLHIELAPLDNESLAMIKQELRNMSTSWNKNLKRK